MSLGLLIQHHNPHPLEGAIKKSYHANSNNRHPMDSTARHTRKSTTGSNPLRSLQRQRSRHETRTATRTSSQWGTPSLQDQMVRQSARRSALSLWNRICAISHHWPRRPRLTMHTIELRSRHPSHHAIKDKLQIAERP